MRYRVKKVGELTDSVWSYVPTEENSSNFGNRESTPSKFKVLRFKGPGWLSDETDGAKFEKRQERSNVAGEGYDARHCEELGRRAAEKVLLLEAATFNSPSETFHKQLPKVEMKWTYY